MEYRSRRSARAALHRTARIAGASARGSVARPSDRSRATRAADLRRGRELFHALRTAARAGAARRIDRRSRRDLVVSARVVGHRYGAHRRRDRNISTIESHVSVVLLIERSRRMPFDKALVCLERSLLCPVVRTATTRSVRSPSPYAAFVTRGC